MKRCGLKCLLLQGLRAGGYSNKGFLSIGASDALIKPDHRTQNGGLCALTPGLGGWAGTRAEMLCTGRRRVPQPRPQAGDTSLRPQCTSPSAPFTTLHAKYLASPTQLCISSVTGGPGLRRQHLRILEPWHDGAEHSAGRLSDTAFGVLWDEPLLSSRGQAAWISPTPAP